MGSVCLVKPAVKELYGGKEDPSCYHQGMTEAEKWKSIHDAYIKMIEDIKALESKPEVYLLSPLPMAKCCPND